jgi:hypothetical protein
MVCLEDVESSESDWIDAANRQKKCFRLYCFFQAQMVAVHNILLVYIVYNRCE